MHKKLVTQKHKTLLVVLEYILTPTVALETFSQIFKMMKRNRPNLFDHKRNDIYFIPKEYFNSMDDSKFIPMLRNLLEGVIYGDETGVCEFPDPDDEDGDFEGVRFTNWEDEVQIVSEEIMEKLLLEASRRYVLINPKHKTEVEELYRQRGKKSFPQEEVEEEPDEVTIGLIKKLFSPKKRG